MHVWDHVAHATVATDTLSRRLTPRQDTIHGYVYCATLKRVAKVTSLTSPLTLASERQEACSQSEALELPTVSLGERLGGHGGGGSASFDRGGS